MTKGPGASDGLATTITVTDGASPPSSPGDEERALPAGTMVGARYRIERFLGAGGMGAVYLARDLAIGSEVAIKLMLARWRSDIEALTRVRAEVALAHKVTHRNVCRTYDLETIDGHSLVKMEYVSGATLAERLATGPLPLGEAIEITAQIAAGLGAAHAQGVVHCDLKPQNVIVEAGSGRVVLMDFGVSRAATSASGAARGTPAYMAPEAWRRGPIDGRTDLYALGCVMHQMLSGARPFQASTPGEWQARHTETAPPELRGVPRRIARLVRDLMAKDPDARPRDAAVVVQRLRRRSRTHFAIGLAAAVIAVAGGALWLRPAPAWQPDVRTRQPVFQENGDSATISPDGRWLAYDSDRDGSWRVWIEPLAGGEARAVTPPDWVSQSPRFTSDGGAVLVKHVDRIRTMTTVQSLTRIERVPLDGSPPQLVADRAVAADDCRGRIVLGYNSEAGQPARITVLEHGVERLIAAFDGDVELGRFRCAPDGTAFAFNARGTHIAGKGMQIFVGRFDRLPIRQLTFAGPAARPSFTPDGRSIVYAADAHRIGLLSLDGGEPTIVVRGSDALSDPIVTPDGRTLLYLSDTSSLPLSRVDLATGAVTRLARPAEWTFQAASVCHGQLALLTTPSFMLEKWSLEVVDPATGRSRSLGLATAVAAAPDGETIVYATPDRTGTSRLFATDCALAPPRLLATIHGIVGHIAVAQHVVHVSLAASAAVAWRVPLTGGTAEPEGPLPLQHVIPAPVGAHVLVVRNGRLRLIAPGHALDDRDAPELDGETAAWAPDGSAFYYWDGHALVRHELATGRDRVLYPTSFFVGALAPTGDTLYFSAILGQVRREMIVNFADRPRP